MGHWVLKLSLLALTVSLYELKLHDSKTLFQLLGMLLLSAANFCLLNGNCVVWSYELENSPEKKKPKLSSSASQGFQESYIGTKQPEHCWNPNPYSKSQILPTEQKGGTRQNCTMVHMMNRTFWTTKAPLGLALKRLLSGLPAKLTPYFFSTISNDLL